MNTLISYTLTPYTAAGENEPGNHHTIKATHNQLTFTITLDSQHPQDHDHIPTTWHYTEDHLVTQSGMIFHIEDWLEDLFNHYSQEP